jgi:hypothetical protein
MWNPYKAREERETKTQMGEHVQSWNEVGWTWRPHAFITIKNNK